MWPCGNGATTSSSCARSFAGGTDKSYGIQVARLAGLPGPVLSRAREILRQLEEGHLDDSGQPKLARARQKKQKAREVVRELDLFGRGE